MQPNPDRAREILEEASRQGANPEFTRTDFWVAVSEALGFLRGYPLPKDRLDAYRCTSCGASGVKLWRAAHSDSEAWCARCGTAQAGLPDDVGEDGRRPSEYSGRADGRSDQIYSPRQGHNLLPYVPAVDGGTWGYTSVPAEGVEWWRGLPTRRDD